MPHGWVVPCAKDTYEDGIVFMEPRLVVVAQQNVRQVERWIQLVREAVIACNALDLWR